MAKAKTVDTWKTKQWYTVNAPELFEGKQIAQLVATEDALLMNRIVRVALSDLSGDMSHAYTMLDFRINDVRGKSAFTKFIGHELSKSYLRTLIRRRRHVIAEVVDVTTKDGQGVRIKISAFTGTKISTPLRSVIRNALHAEVLAAAKEIDFPAFVQEIIFGKLSSRLFNRVKKMAPIRRIEIRKSELKESFAA
ncbi:MAG: 30S ribosomal protein S3ae [Candidatus Micrarchaeia archaeon]|jgi:small subunit ribosomal protein S3Ae